MHFAYIKVPLQGLDPRAADALHHSLEQALSSSGMGALVSWGTSVPSAGTKEGDPGSFHRVDVEVHELELGLQLLREVLSKFGVPHGTELHFTVKGAALQQSLSASGWGSQVQSTGTHRPRPANGAA